MKAVDLVCVGESFEDLIFGGLDRLPRLGEEWRTKSFLRTFGGGPTITAVAAARLGVATGIVSALSAEAASRLRAEGVRVTNLRKSNEPHAVTAALSTRKDRAFVTFDGVNEGLGPRLVKALGSVRARFVHCALLPRDLPVLIAAVHALRARGTKVSLDLGHDFTLARDRHLPALIAEVDFLLINEDEAKLYSGRKSSASVDAFWKARSRNTVIKLGARGSRWISANATVEEAAPKVTPVDTTGAGDAFNAGFLAALLSGLSPNRALRLGNTVGALSTRALGGLDGLPRLDEI